MLTDLTFYTGAPESSWLARTTRPLFVSHTRLRRRRSLPRATCRWALDSGGFTEISQHGRWTITAVEYAAAARRYAEEVGGLEWAAPQDWMCEPDQLARTGMTVAEHQARTVENYLELRAIAPDLPFVPALQGWAPASYVACIGLYAAAGVDLAALPLVGVGSLCRRPSALSVALVLDAIAREGLSKLHGFGVKTSALRFAGERLISADSQAWSAAARARQERCEEGRRECRNCLHYAIAWGEDTEASWRDRATSAHSVLT